MVNFFRLYPQYVIVYSERRRSRKRNRAKEVLKRRAKEVLKRRRGFQAMISELGTSMMWWVPYTP